MKNNPTNNTTKLVRIIKDVPLRRKLNTFVRGCSTLKDTMKIVFTLIHVLKFSREFWSPTPWDLCYMPTLAQNSLENLKATQYVKS